ncbi:aldose 1-epimerase, partial [Pleomassaria siparia CBS 279.74]
VTVGDRTVKASLPSGDAVEIYYHGATVTSWTSSSGDSQIFLSTASVLDGSAAIRGGIPVVFPNFGTPPKNHSTSNLPSHGFARNSTWDFQGSEEEEEGAVVVMRFHLNSSMLSLDYQTKWPQSVDLAYTLTLAENSLTADLRVDNTDVEAWEFQFLLHSYMSVPDISGVTVSGLQGSTYQDKTKNYTVVTETSDAVTIVNETDRIYTPLSDEVVLNYEGDPRVTVTKNNLPDVTVWNLWETKANTTKDFAPKDAWQRYLAIEPGSVVNFTRLAPGSAWEAS